MARVSSELVNVPGPAPSLLFGSRRTLAAFRRDPILYLQDLHREYGDVVAIAHVPSPVVAVSRVPIGELLAQPYLFQSATLPVSPVADLSHEQLRVLHDHTLHAVQQAMDRWGVGQLVDMIYVARRVVLQSILASFFHADLPGEDGQTLVVGLQSWLHDAVATPYLVGRVSSQGGVLNLNIPAKLHDVFVSMLANAPHAPVKHMFAPQDVIPGAIALAALVCEMTALTVGWTVFLLGQHVGVVDDLIMELRTVLADASPTCEQILDNTFLGLLDGVVRESLRVLPPSGIGSLITRTSWPYAPFRFPVGTTIVYSPYLMQRSPQMFFAPDRFRPQRWTQIEPAPSAFLPVGVMPLADLVLPLVLAQAKLMVALIYRQYQLVPAAGMPVNRARSLLLAPQKDIPMVITPTHRAVPRRVVQGSIRDLIYLP